MFRMFVLLSSIATLSGMSAGQSKYLDCDVSINGLGDSVVVPVRFNVPILTEERRVTLQIRVREPFKRPSDADGATPPGLRSRSLVETIESVTAIIGREIESGAHSDPNVASHRRVGVHLQDPRNRMTLEGFLALLGDRVSGLVRLTGVEPTVEIVEGLLPDRVVDATLEDGSAIQLIADAHVIGIAHVEFDLHLEAQWLRKQSRTEITMTYDGLNQDMSIADSMRLRMAPRDGYDSGALVPHEPEARRIAAQEIHRMLSTLGEFEHDFQSHVERKPVGEMLELSPHIYWQLFGRQQRVDLRLSGTVRRRVG